MDKLELIRNISIPEEPEENDINPQKISFEDLLLISIIFLLVMEKNVDIVLVFCIVFLFLDIDMDLGFNLNLDF